MAYRAPAPSPPPRVLVVRPQRAATSAVFMTIGGAALLGILYTAVSSIVTHGFGPRLAFFALLAAFVSIFFVTGLHGWLLRVEIALFDDGALTLSFTRWPLRGRQLSLARADVHDVIVESDDGTSKIVIVTKHEPIPLTGSATSDTLDGKVAEIKRFLELT